MSKRNDQLAADLGLLALRATMGGLLAGHGAQKLFGSFGGHGLHGTAGWLESMGMQPGKVWALLAGGSEFSSGAMMALGALGPIGPISAFAPMITAWLTAHKGKPIWATSGGAELPLMYMSAATALALTGPGRFSLDEALDIEVPPALAVLAAAGVAAGIAIGLTQRAAPLAAGDAAINTGSDNEQSNLQDESSDIVSGMASSGGIGNNIDPHDAEIAAEVGADPPGPVAFDLRDMALGEGQAEGDMM